MLKILLIDANSSWLVERRDIQDLEQIIPPIGLMYLAGYLKKQFQEKVETKIVNLVATCRTQKGLGNIIMEFKPDIVGIRGLNIYKKVFHETAALAKSYDSNVIVVGGGPYITMDVEKAGDDMNIDYFVVGEGEITFAEMVAQLLDGRTPIDVKGVAYRQDGDLVLNDSRAFIDDLDILPFPDYNLISVDQYSRFISYGYNRRRQAVIVSSRGCPYKCIYCHNIFGRKNRTRTAQNVFDEIQHLYHNFDIKDFYFVDDSLNLDYKRAMDLFDKIIDSKIDINIYFANGIRGDIVDRAFIDKMIEAGVVWLVFAIETASPRLQKYIKKYLDLERIAENIHYTCSKNIMANCCVMTGFPTETVEESLQTVEFLKQFKKIIVPMFFSVKYYPHTEIYDLATKEGIDVGKIEDSYAETYHNVRHAGTPLIPEKAFRDIYFKFLSEVFLSKERLTNAIEIQRKYFSEQEILDCYSIFFRKRINDIQKDVLRYAK